MKHRFLLDENVALAVQRQLRRRNTAIELLAVGDPGAPPLRSPDPEILRWIEANGIFLSPGIAAQCQDTLPTTTTREDACPVFC